MQPKLSPIKEIEIKANKIFNCVSLAQGTPSFDTPACIKRKAIEVLANGKADRYSLSPGLLELREAIEYNLSKQNINYDFENEIIITAGSIEAITASLLAITEEGDEVLIPNPSYTSYQEAIKTAKAKPVFVPLEENKKWGFNIDKLKEKITSKTKALLFCNPNNPTSTIYSKEDLFKILELAEIHNFYILSDEVYKDFIYDDTEYYSLASFSNFRKRIIYIFSFSKAYSMTGWRVAYLATHEQLARKILAVHDAIITCAPVISQWGALTALEMADEDILKFKKAYIKRRELIWKYLEEMREYFFCVYPNSAYFVFPRFSNLLIDYIEKIKKEKNKENNYFKSNSWFFAFELMREAKIAVVPGLAFGSKGENHLRMCFGRSEEDIKCCMERLKKYLNDNFNSKKNINEKNI